MSRISNGIKVGLLSDEVFSTTGNARVGRELLKGLTKLGYDTYNLAVGMDEAEYEKEGIKMLPITQHGFEERYVKMFLHKLETYIIKFKFDFIIILGDRIHWQQLGIGRITKGFLKTHGTKLIFWETVDSDSLLCTYYSLRMNNPHIQIYNACDHIVPTSYYGKNVLEAEFIKTDTVIWECVDTDRFLPVSKEKQTEMRKGYRFRKDDFIFLHIGRCMRRKNPELVLEALYPLLIEYPNARYFGLIPEYDKSDKLNLIDYVDRVLAKKYGGRNLIDEQKILFCTSNQQSLSLANGVDDDEMVRFYQISDCIISGSSNEGFNLLIGESLSAGLPYIGINNTTTAELTNNGEVGFIAQGSVNLPVGHGMVITSTSVPELREQAKKVLELSPEKKKEISEKGRKFIEERIGRGLMISKWSKFLKSIKNAEREE